MISLQDRQTAAIRKVTEAATSLLLGGTPMIAGTAITAGAPLDAEGLRAVARAAGSSHTDVVHLAFTDGADGLPAPAGVQVVVEREGIAYAFASCRLELPQGARRAVIVPGDKVRGHFAMTPGELLHEDGKPKGLRSDNAARAERRLRALMREEAPGAGLATYSELPLAA